MLEAALNGEQRPVLEDGVEVETVEFFAGALPDAQELKARTSLHDGLFFPHSLPRCR